MAPGCVLCECPVRGPRCGYRGGVSRPDPGGGHIRPPQPPDPKEGRAASASLPPERPFPASELPQGQEREGLPQEATDQQHLHTGGPVEGGKGKRVLEAMGTLQGPSAERELLQSARGQASHTPASPGFIKVAVRREQRHGSEMPADRDHGLGVQTPHPSPKGERGRNQGE